jgi:uroporphyrinogen decarboxylase
MTGRELFTGALLHQEIDRLPRDLWMVPYIYQYRQKELDRFRELFPVDLTYPSGMHYGKSHYVKGEAYRKGSYTDEFGTIWEELEDGVTGEVKKPIIQSMNDLDRYRLPWELLDEADFSGQTQAYGETDKFVIAGSYVRPFERMQFLRGTENLFVDIALEDPLFLQLRDRLHEFNLREMKMLAAQAVDAISFMDDWGSQRSLLISPASWRKYFKPMYREYCDIMHAAGKFVFFHSDGHTEAIYDDLIEIGVDAYNSQLFCMDIEMLGEKYKGKITFWGELDRQGILPFGTEEDVRESVRRLGRAMMTPRRTGFIAQCSWETVTPLANVIAGYDEFNRL